MFQSAFVTGYLRLKRRYRILCIIRDLKTSKAYVEPSNKVQLEKLQSVSTALTFRSYYQDRSLQFFTFIFMLQKCLLPKFLCILRTGVRRPT